MKSLLLLGGSDETNGDYSRLKAASKRNGVSLKRWSSLKDAVAGDELWFYVTAPDSAIVAVGVAADDAHRGDNWPYEITVKNLKWIENHITADELRSMFPDWAWTKNTRGKTHLDDDRAQKLRDRVEAGSNTVEPNTKRSKSGAGFGNPEQNKAAETAAVKHVTKCYEQDGYEVHSVEAEKCGYDLIARKNRRERHLEVKGVASEKPEFPITPNEVDRARNDKDFRLVVVVSALERRRRAIDMSGAQFLEKYDLRAVTTYIAKQKK